MKIEYYLSKKADTDEKRQIYARLTLSRENRPTLKTGVFVKSVYFCDGEIKVSGRSASDRDATKAREQLQRWELRVLALTRCLSKESRRDEIVEAMEMTKEMSIDEMTEASVRHALESPGYYANRVSLIYWYLRFVDEHGKDLSKGRVARLKVLGKILGRFELWLKYKHHRRAGWHLYIDDVSRTVIDSFHDYLRDEKTLSERYPDIFARIMEENVVKAETRDQCIQSRGRNVIVVYMKALKEFFNWLRTHGVITNSPFDGVKIESETYGTPYYLTLEERNRIADADIGHLIAEAEAKGEEVKEADILEEQRDIFVFQCCVGCRVSDLMRLASSNIDGGVLSYIPRKTRKERSEIVRVPLNERAMEIVRKYQGRDEEGRLLPYVDPITYNVCIKGILKLCGIDRHVTILNSITGEEEQHPIWELGSSHLARRTFVGNLYKRVKDPEIIGSMSGHAPGSRAFARYRDIDDDIKKDVIKLIE